MSRISLKRAFTQISGLTLISRVLGFIRDICFAHFLGAGSAADAFLVAFKLPNLFRRLTAEGALTNAFLPVYALAKEKQGQPAALILAAEVQTALLLALSAIVIIMEIFMPAIIAVLAPGFNATPERFESAVQLARLTMPYLPMISLVALWAALLNSADEFIAGALPPVILNIFLIAGAIAIPFSADAMQTGPVMLALPLTIALLLAGLCQMAVLQAGLRRKSLTPKWRFGKMSERSRAMWRGFVPAALGAGATQINLLVDLILASLLQIGAISWLYYADRIAQLPLGLVGIALGTALLPRLSSIEAGTEKSLRKQKFAQELSAGIMPAACLVLPATAALLIIAEPIIIGLFRSGAFSLADGRAAAAALVAYAIGLPAFVGLKLTAAALYALQKARLVMIISLISVALNIVLSLYLMRIFGHVGLALATVLVSWMGFVWQLLWLGRAGRLEKTPVRAIFLSTFCSAIMAASLYFLMPLVGAVIASQTGGMVVLVLSGGAIYFLTGWFTGLLRLVFFSKTS
jgi:putative peptidoglycan lipid II flippase